MKSTLARKLTSFALASQVFVNAAPAARSVREAPKALDACFAEYESPIEALELDMFRNKVKGCAWTGHVSTDTDSIAGAIGAADLFGGIAARSSDLNDESEWVLEQFDFPTPEAIGNLPEVNICLVDVNQITQLPQEIQVNTNRIVAIIDHHALQSSSVVIDQPISIDIKPVGSASSIVASYYGLANQHMSEDIAGVLMSAIISDTLNLSSPTTTELDRMMLSCLAKQSNTNDLDTYIDELFQAKANGYNKLSDDEVVRSDTKVYDLCGDTVVWATVETTDPTSMMARKDGLAESLKVLKEEDDADYAFLSIVDVVNINTDLILIGEEETELAGESFNATTNADDDMVMNIGERVSRKLDFIPPIQATLCDE